MTVASIIQEIVMNKLLAERSQNIALIRYMRYALEILETVEYHVQILW